MAGENTEPLPASVWTQRTAEKLSLSSPIGSLFRDPVEEEQVIKWFSQHFVLRSEFQAGRISVKQDEPGPHEGDVGEQRPSKIEETRRPSWLRSRDVNQLTEYILEESVWDAMFFLGMGETGTLGSLLTAFALVVNVVLQVFFLLVINHTVVEKNFTDEELRGLEAWRIQVGHDMKYVSSLNGLSLVDRVCARDPTLEVSTDQVHKMGVIEDYLPQGDTLFQGPTMCLVALGIWTLVCLKEVSVTLDLMRAVARLPSGKGQGSAFRPTDEGGLELVQVHPYRKLAAIVVTVVRLSVVGALFFIGLKYLANTVSISDLILNAGALEMVMTIDELVFAAMIPARVAALTRSLATLPMQPWREFRGADVKSLLAPVSLIACLLFLWYGELRTAISNINEARETLCSGNRSFGFEKDGLEVVRVTGLNSINLAMTMDPSDMDVLAVRDVSHPSSAAGPSWKFGLPWTLQSEKAVIIQDMDYNSINRMMTTVQDVYAAVDTNNCSDSPEQYWNVSQWHLAKSLGIPGPLASCEQVRPYCRFFDGQTLRSMVMLRALCPRTCGCNSMLSGTAFISPELGCPTQCLVAVAPEERSSAPCDNMNLTDPADPRLPSLLEWAGEAQSLLPGINLTRMVSTLGCGLIQLMRTPPPGLETASIDFCDSADGSLHYARYGDGNAIRGRTLKLMTFFCPRTCNCDGHSNTLKRPPEKFCPERCSA